MVSRSKVGGRTGRGAQAAIDLADEHDGDDLRDLPLIDRKRLARLLGRAKRYSIRFVEHLTGDGPTVFPCLPAGGHRVEADGCALSQRPVEGVAQVDLAG